MMHSTLLCTILSIGLLCALVVPTVQVVADAGTDNDIATLQYALTLERLEAAFYAKGQSQFTAAQFNSANFQGAYEYFGLIAAHEAAHVSAIANTITQLGGSPVPACTYSFSASGFDSVNSYVSTALTLESTGVSAYDGALNAFTSETLMQVAATIATIEARHTSYLSTLTGMNPFPQSTDTAKTPAQIIRDASSFFTSCPFNLTANLPIIRPTGVATTSSRAAAQPSSQRPAANVAYTQQQFDNDLVALNYALTLEHLEAEFYNAGQARFTQSDFENAYPGKGQSYFTQFNLIKDHENAHVTALTNTINGRGGSAVPVCSYNFTASKIPTIQQYVATAQLLENTGVSAYDGAANTFTDTGLQQVAATIVTVEARHAAFLNGIVSPSQALPASDKSFDTATAPADIVSAVLATGLITSCPYTPAGPVKPSSYVTASSSSTGHNAAYSDAPSVFVAAALLATTILMLTKMA